MEGKTIVVTFIKVVYSAKSKFCIIMGVAGHVICKK